MGDNHVLSTTGVGYIINILIGGMYSALPLFLINKKILGFIADMLFCLFIVPLRSCVNVARIKAYNEPQKLSNLLLGTFF